MAITDKQKKDIELLRSQNKGYKTISKELGIHKETIRYYCIKKGTDGNRATQEYGEIECKQCGKRFIKKTTTQIYCCVKCRNKSNHKENEIKIKVCEWCGNEYQANNNSTKYCSVKCKNKIRSKKKNRYCITCGKELDHSHKYCSKECKNLTYTHTCLFCKKEFNSSNKNQKYCSRQCSAKHSRPSGTSINQYGDIKEREKKFEETFNISRPEFVYVSGYTDQDSSFVMKCKTCGQTQERNAQITRPSRAHKGLTCDYCNSLARAKKELIEALTKFIKNQISETNKTVAKEIWCIKSIAQKHKYFNICECCGKEYFSDKEKNYCSKRCYQRTYDKLRFIRKRKQMYENGDVDESISIERLIERDNNKCHICGGDCDKGDFEVNGKGHWIVGRNYPSIDHVVPVSRGGTHQWKNIKLAHHYCNTIKRDYTYYATAKGQYKMIL